MALTSDFGILEEEEIRGIQSKLYEAAMKQTLTLETLKTYKEHLDTDIKIVVGPHCYTVGESFENNFYERRQRDVCVEGIVDKYSAAIKIGYCQGCEVLKPQDMNQFVSMYNSVFGVSLLHCFMMSDRNLPLIAFLHESGCNMMKPTLHMKFSPLTLAVSDKQVEIVKYFVKHFDKPEFQSCFLKALKDATTRKEPCLEIMKTLLSAKWINVDSIFPNDEDRLLMKVLKNQSVSYLSKCGILQLLLEAGASPDMLDYKRKPPLLYCIARERIELVELFIEFGANVDIYGRADSNQNSEFIFAMGNQTTPLLLAIEKNNYDICRILLEAGANPNLSSKPLKSSPLGEAAAKGSVALIKLLIRYGADVTHVNVNGGSVVLNAVTSGVIGKLEKMETLLYADAPHDNKDLAGNTPLMMVSLFGCGKDIMKALLDHELGCDVNNVNQFGDTPLHFAAFSKDPVAVKLLIDYGGDPNHHNGVGATPLWNAVHDNCTEVVYQFLVANVKMDTYSVGRDGKASAMEGSELFFYHEPRSTLYVALDKKNRDIVLLLKAAGYDIRKENWIESEPIPHEDLNAGLIIDWIASSKSPMSLETLCKIKLRKNLASEPNRDIYQKVERLEIPQHLKNCLLLKDLS